MEESYLEQKTTECPSNGFFGSETRLVGEIWCLDLFSCSSSCSLKLCCIWDVNQPPKYCRFIFFKNSADKVFIFFIFYLYLVDVKLEAQQSRRRLRYVWCNRSKFSWMWCLWRFFTHWMPVSLHNRFPQKNLFRKADWGRVFSHRANISLCEKLAIFVFGLQLIFLNFCTNDNGWRAHYLCLSAPSVVWRCKLQNQGP